MIGIAKIILGYRLYVEGFKQDCFKLKTFSIQPQKQGRFDSYKLFH